MSNTITISKVKKILHLYRQGDIINRRATARKFKISRNTVKRYLGEIKTLSVLYPEKIQDENAFVQHLIFDKEIPVKHQELLKLFPSILRQLENSNFNLIKAWEHYKSEYHDGYEYSRFCFIFGEWRASMGIRKIPSNTWRVSISENDLQILKKWRRCSDRRKWEKAVVLIESNKGSEIIDIVKKVERSDDKVKEWIRAYEKNGLKALFRKKRKINEIQILHIKNKKNNLIKLIHETPHIHGINRASWCLKSLSKAYQKAYGEPLSKTSISAYIKSEGYSFRKAKETLTSPDPNYREKLQKINDILSNLGEREKFFSVDEYGPFSVKIKGGRSLVKNGELKTFPQRQKSKGFLICTAALELSTNQISHFYSLKKNTKEMIKLLEMLLNKYSTEERIFFSWDAASWHASNELYTKIKEVNDPEYRAIHKTPLIELAPLPASAQFLNVIESVFSGLAKAIIHNSNYESVDNCKNAIDQYFSERNTFFKNHPKRAGKKIWGKELVKSVFSETHNCKDPKWR